MNEKELIDAMYQDPDYLPPFVVESRAKMRKSAFHRRIGIDQENRREQKKARHKRRNSLEFSTKEQFLQYRKTRLVYRRRRIARKKGLEFTVTADTLVWPTHCPILGIELDYFTRGVIKADLPSIDRVDPKYGYHPWNARIVSLKGNSLKSGLTPEQLELILAYVHRVKDEASNISNLAVPDQIKD